MRKTVAATISIAAFIAGLLIGGFGAVLYTGSLFGESLVSYRQLQFIESGEDAFDAYQNESPSVGIYVLSRHLDKLDDTEELTTEGVGLVSQKDIDVDRVITHGRLAKLHQAGGSETQSADHVAKAIKLGAELNLPVNDQNSLIEFVERADRQDEST